jgi:hypothetical protein
MKKQNREYIDKEYERESQWDANLTRGNFLERMTDYHKKGLTEDEAVELYKMWRLDNEKLSNKESRRKIDAFRHIFDKNRDVSVGTLMKIYNKDSSKALAIDGTEVVDGFTRSFYRENLEYRMKNAFEKRYDDYEVCFHYPINEELMKYHQYIGEVLSFYVKVYIDKDITPMKVSPLKNDSDILVQNYYNESPKGAPNLFLCTMLLPLDFEWEDGSGTFEDIEVDGKKRRCFVVQVEPANSTEKYLGGFSAFFDITDCKNVRLVEDMIQPMRSDHLGEVEF